MDFGKAEGATNMRRDVGRPDCAAQKGLPS